MSWSAPSAIADVRTTARMPAFRSRRTWPPSSTSTSSTKAWPRACATGWRRSSALSSGSPPGRTASRSRAASRSPTSASRHSRPPSGRSRKSAAPADRLVEILPSEHADEDAVGARHDDSGELLVAHPLRNLLPPRARPDRARPERHRVFGRDALAGAQCPPAEETLDDAFAVRDDADLPLVAHAFGDVGDELVGQAPRSIRTGDAPDARAAVGRALERKPERAPVGLARDVVVDAGEAEVFEPRRGSWARVSLGVVAVNDHRPLRVERGRRFAVQRLQRDVDRARELLVLEFVRRENLDELRLLFADE